jgi:hypothetical protein
MHTNIQNLNLDSIPRNARELFTIVKEFNVNFGYERSFKLLKNSLLSNRHLISIGNLGTNHTDMVLEVCRKLQIPEDFLDSAKSALDHSDLIHFGFEEEDDSCIYKVYFEFSQSYQQQLSRISPDEIALCLALKWDANGNGAQVKTKYIHHPSLDKKQTVGRINDIYENHNSGNPTKYLHNILDLIPKHVPSDELIYLEVEEESNPRNSYDFNLYSSGVRLKDLYSQLVGLTHYYHTPLDQFLSLYNTIKDLAVGHISGGIDRKGRDFTTIYYGLKGYKK